MRAALLAVALCAAPGAAWAQLDPDAQPDGFLIAETPEELRRYDEPAARRRIEEIDRTLRHLRDPKARANARLDRATLRAAQARRDRIAWIEKLIARDTTRGEAARRALDPEIARLRAAAEQSAATAIAELTELVCDPASRGHDLSCRTPSALRTWPALDEALYRLAWALALEKRTDDAARAYRRILDEVPRSRHRTHALLAVGDHAFEQADFAAAEALYREAQADPAPAAAQLRAYATYKLGWVHLNLSRGKEAFAGFTAVIAATGTDPRAKTLAQAARADLVHAFAMYGAPAAAFAAFEGAAPGHGLRLLERLADQWLDQGKAADAIAAFRELQQRMPADPRRCTWQLEIARGERLAGITPELVHELDALATVAASTRGQPAAESCDREARSLVYGTARHLLHGGAARRGPATRSAAAEQAEQLFAAFVREFPDDPDAGAARLQRAQATVAMAEAATGEQAAVLWRRAAVRFDEAAQHAVGTADRERAIEARDRARKRAAAP